MCLKSLNRFRVSISRQPTLQTIVIVPFVVQLLGTVGLVGYLSFRNGQAAVNDVAAQLRREISDRTSERITTYLKTPHLINRTNADAIRLGQLDITDSKSLERYFLKQIQVFDSLSRIYFSNPQGGLTSVGYDERGLTVALTENFTQGTLRVYSVDGQGNRNNILVNQPNYDARKRPFYQYPVDLAKPTWCPIYIYIPTSRGLGIAASYPFYDENGQFQGVLSSDLSLVAINQFLQSLKIGSQGEAFIIERSGMLVASSSSERPYKRSGDGKQKQRLKATETKNPLIRATAQHLISNLGDFNQINTSKQIAFNIKSKQQFAQVTPFRDEWGLDWLIVVVVPESDFMQQINANNRTTILLCLLAVIVEAGIGIITARWITKPLLKLNTAAKKIAQGKWGKAVDIQRSDEVGQLATSFNQMAAQLQQAQEILANYSRTLEQEVAERTEALRHSEERLRLIIEATTEGIWDWDIVQNTSFWSEQIYRLLGLPKSEIELNSYHSIEQRLHPEDRVQFAQALPDHFEFNSPYNLEVRIQRTDGDYGWFRVCGKALRDRNGQPYRMVGSFTDITDRKAAELALKQQTEILQTIFDHLPVMLCFYNAEIEVQFINPTFESTLGWSLAELQEIDIMAHCYPDPDYRASVLEFMTRADGTWRDLEVRTRAGDILFTSWTNVRLPNGCIVGLGTDITARKQAEAALQDSALRERVIATVLQRMRQTLDINSIFSATTCELQQVLNCDRVAIYRFNSDWSGEFVAESVANGWVPLIAAQKHDASLTQQALEDENCIIKALDSANSPIPLPSPPTQPFNSLVQDTYLQNTQGGIYRQGASYRVIEDIYKAAFSPCYIKLLERFQAKSYIIVPIYCGHQLWGLLATYQNSHPRAWSQPQISAVVQIGVQLGVALQQAQLLHKTQQQAVDLEQALTELKRTQTQLIHTEKMSSLGRMVAGIAHEINNPVSFIYGNLTPARHYFQDLLSLIELYQQTYLESTPEIEQLTAEIDLDFVQEDWEKLIHSMEVGTERIREIVLSLRNFSRLDEHELKTVDIHEGIDSTLLILQHRLKVEGNRCPIQVIKEYGSLPAVTCYASQLNQVFMNLLNNAIDALEQHAGVIPTLTIRTEVKTKGWLNPHHNSSNCSFVVIHICDNGSGMSEEIKKHIFDPFFTTKPVGSGTGLGLSICYQIVVEKHQGEISCTSALGQGTEFIVEIPIEPTHAEY
jgi:PAS domain S-box-containing protein